ncbi:MAG: PilZ domain-containing protein [Gammaproteobacteria bacterium]
MDDRESTDTLCRRTMEHRTNLRLPVRRPAQLQLADGCLVHGEIRDASFEGAYVRAAPPPGEVPRGCGRLLLRARPGDAPTTVDIPVLVVRLDERGIGVMFGDYGMPAENGLRRLFDDCFSEP